MAIQLWLVFWYYKVIVGQISLMQKIKKKKINSYVKTIFAYIICKVNLLCPRSTQSKVKKKLIAKNGFIPGRTSLYKRCSFCELLGETVVIEEIQL